jgi:phosphoglycerate dehydrogenase-like enzyme
VNTITVGVSPRTYGELGSVPRPWLQFEVVTGSGIAPEVLWRRQHDPSAWVETALRAAPSLRWLHTDTVGIDRLPLDIIRQRGIWLSNARGVYTPAVSQWVTASVLLAANRFHVVVRRSDLRIWRAAEGVRELAGETVVILGLGSIGLAVARQCAALGMRVVGVVRSAEIDRQSPAEAGVADVLCSAEPWQDALTDAGYLIVCAPLTEATKGMVDSAVLRTLPQRAWIVNAGRGEIVDEAALVHALDQESIGGAVLDTFVQEPLDPRHPLWGRENVIISPHSSSFSDQGPVRTRALFLKEVERYRAGQQPHNIVSIERGY